MNEYTVSPEVLRSLKAGLAAAAPPSRSLSPGGTPPAPPRDSLYALGQRDRRAAVLRFCGRG